VSCRVADNASDPPCGTVAIDAGRCIYIRRILAYTGMIVVENKDSLVVRIPLDR
jgi:hypothetical protein